MKEKRSLTKRFRIRAQIDGIPPDAYIAGYFETEDEDEISMLRGLPENMAVEVGLPEPLVKAVI